jgi:hypothetical protein
MQSASIIVDRMSAAPDEVDKRERYAAKRQFS